MQMSVTSFHRMSPPNLGLRVSCFTTTLPGNSQDEEGRIVHAQRSPRLEDFIADIKGDEKWQFEKLVRAQQFCSILNVYSSSLYKITSSRSCRPICRRRRRKSLQSLVLNDGRSMEVNGAWVVPFVAVGRVGERQSRGVQRQHLEVGWRIDQWGC